jgi:hypothetical protein
MQETVDQKKSKCSMGGRVLPCTHPTTQGLESELPELESLNSILSPLSCLPTASLQKALSVCQPLTCLRWVSDPTSRGLQALKADQVFSTGLMQDNWAVSTLGDVIVIAFFVTITKT